MAKKNKIQMYQRSDGLYEKAITDSKTGKRVMFRAKSPEDVLKKMFEYKDVKEKGELFCSVADEWWAMHSVTLTSNSRKNYKCAYNRLSTFFAGIYIKDITIQNLTAFIDYIKIQHAIKGKKTIDSHILVARLIFEYACIKEYIQNSPAEHLKSPKGLKKSPRKFPTDEDIQIVKKSTDKTFGLLYFFILYTGCRLGEVSALTWSDIDFKNEQIHITKSLYYDDNNSYRPEIKPPKTQKAIRDIPLLKKLAVVIAPLEGKANELLFPSSKGAEILMGNKESWNLQQKYKEETGIDITPHQLRHAFATMCFEAGLEAKDMQDILGHTTLAMSQDIYSHIRDKRRTTSAEKLNKSDF